MIGLETLSILRGTVTLNFDGLTPKSVGIILGKMDTHDLVFMQVDDKGSNLCSENDCIYGQRDRQTS